MARVIPAHPKPRRNSIFLVGAGHACDSSTSNSAVFASVIRGRMHGILVHTQQTPNIASLTSQVPHGIVLFCSHGTSDSSSPKTQKKQHIFGRSRPCLRQRYAKQHCVYRCNPRSDAWHPQTQHIPGVQPLRDSYFPHIEQTFKDIRLFPIVITTVC